MNGNIIDLRSDTVTKPSPEMREYMCRAEVGDDVMGEDPSVKALEEYAAALFEKEDALFVPSGTMANQISVRVYAGPGDEILMIDEAHLFWYEGGGAAGLSGVQLHPVPMRKGKWDVYEFQKRIRGIDPHFPRTRLFWIENTHNRWGGKIIPFEFMLKLNSLSKEVKIPIHMDGARIANAAVATGIGLQKWGALCDSLSICLSKGLGAPVGSLLLGRRTFIEKCRFARKTLGGGMRQAGFIAAAGLFALKNNIKRISEDHLNARYLQKGLDQLDGIFVGEVETNIVLIHLEESSSFSAEELVEKVREYGIKLFALDSQRIRAVTHQHIGKYDIERVVEVFSKAIGILRNKGKGK